MGGEHRQLCDDDQVEQDLEGEDADGDHQLGHRGEIGPVADRMIGDQKGVQPIERAAQEQCRRAQEGRAFRRASCGQQEGEDGEAIRDGCVYVAPGDFHMLLKPGTPPTIQLTQTAPENFCRPSVDPMLRSMAAIYGNKLLTVILTGMGHAQKGAVPRQIRERSQIPLAVILPEVKESIDPETITSKDADYIMLDM